MNLTALSRSLFIGAGIYALACAPAALIAERFGWPQKLFHLSQMIAVILCLPTSLIYLWCTRGTSFGTQRWWALIAAFLCALWLGFVAYVITTFEGGGMG